MVRDDQARVVEQSCSHSLEVVKAISHFDRIQLAPRVAVCLPSLHHSLHMLRRHVLAPLESARDHLALVVATPEPLDADRRDYALIDYQPV